MNCTYMCGCTSISCSIEIVFIPITLDQLYICMKSLYYIFLTVISYYKFKKFFVEFISVQLK